MVGYSETKRGSAIVTTESVSTLNDTQSGIVTREQRAEGLDTELIDYSGMFIGGSGRNMKVHRFYEETQGYQSDIINERLEIPSRLESITSLQAHHNLVLFVSGGDIFTIAFGNQRSVKGFTKWNFKTPAKKIVSVDDDKVVIILEGGHAYMADMANIDHMTDDLVGEDSPTTYPTVIRPMPIINGNYEDFRVRDSLQIRSFILGFSGDAAFDYEIINSLTGTKVNRAFVRHDRNSVEDRSFNGLLWVNNLPTNGSPLPELRIVKDDDKYIEVSSINILLGDT